MDALVYEDQMEIDGFTKHSDLNIMTMTMIGYFTGKIKDVNQIFYLLPITKVPSKKPLRPVKKIKIEHPGMSGLIMSARFGNETRGIVKSITKGTWDHSVMIDVSAANKNINAKLSKTNIQMCGLKTYETCEEVCKILVETVNSIQFFMNIINDNKNLYSEISKQVLDTCRGDMIEIEEDVYHFEFDPYKISPHDDDTEEAKFIRMFLYMQLTDVCTYDDALNKINWIANLDPEILEDGIPLEYESCRVAMVKYRFSLGFHVDQSALSELFQDEDPDFFVDYFANVRNYVKIEIPCKNSASTSGPDVKKHTFSVQPTGQTTHSSPVLEETEEFYYRFIRVIDAIKDDIQISS